ncbi:Ataxin-3 [Schistosoma japonicum]|uniref:ubiquitinyl hydrolase 1 n=1 Tax=Schistosoma japonicum TaxID=6182 RepID=A0A4Z2D5C0_SCHJA|nr:Ataxin-3 [Schistosoma japonicum]
MELIFHEKQDGSLCAQHCLNALLQGPYFTAVDLANIAKQLDETEESQLGSSHTTPYGFQNMDETGYFSIQVISQALQIWCLELVPFLRQCSEAERARENPASQNAFICHYQHHWFTIRKIGKQWFNLNSILSAPKLISETYLAIYLAQLKEEGNSIFFVTGTLPRCEADEILSVCPFSEDTLSTSPTSSTKRIDKNTEVDIALAISEADADDDDKTLQRVLHSSANDDKELLDHALKVSADEYKDISDMELHEAIALSLTSLGDPNFANQNATRNGTDSINRISTEEIRRNRQLFFDKFSLDSNTKG